MVPLLPSLFVVSLSHFLLYLLSFSHLLFFFLNVFLMVCLDHSVPYAKLFRVVTVHLPDPIRESRGINRYHFAVLIWRVRLELIQRLWPWSLIILEYRILNIWLESCSHLFVSIGELLFLIHWNRPYLIQLRMHTFQRVKSKWLLLHDVSSIVIFPIL